jgi:hypothetical protein
MSVAVVREASFFFDLLSCQLLPANCQLQIANFFLTYSFYHGFPVPCNTHILDQGLLFFPAAPKAE